MTNKRPVLDVEKREVLGKKVKHLRSKGIIPGSIYGHKFESVSVQMNLKDTEKLLAQVGESGLVDLKLKDGENLPVLFKNPQYHAMDGKLMHLDLYKVNLKEKITATVPVEFVGESPAVKLGNVLMEITKEVEVEALPTDLPEKIEVDISGLTEVDQAINISDLKYDKDKVEVKNDAEQVVVKIAAPKEEIIEEPTVAPTEVPATEQKAPEAGTEGEEKKEEK
jgi:large subunit ribosomal protein L25